MTKDKALYAFFSGFGLPAYPDNAVLNESGEPDVVLPYLTYTPAFSLWGEYPVSLDVELWYRTESETIPNEKAQEIIRFIGFGGRRILCDEGLIMIYCDSTTWKNLYDEVDPAIKRRKISLIAVYNTLY